MLKVTTAMLCYVALCPPSSGLKVPKSYATLGFPDAHDAFSGYPALEYRHGMGMASDAPNEINKLGRNLRSQTQNDHQRFSADFEKKYGSSGNIPVKVVKDLMSNQASVQDSIVDKFVQDIETATAKSKQGLFEMTESSAQNKSTRQSTFKDGWDDTVNLRFQDMMQRASAGETYLGFQYSSSKKKRRQFLTKTIRQDRTSSSPTWKIYGTNSPLFEESNKIAECVGMLQNGLSDHTAGKLFGLWEPGCTGDEGNPGKTIWNRTCVHLWINEPVVLRHRMPINSSQMESPVSSTITLLSKLRGHKMLKAGDSHAQWNFMVTACSALVGSPSYSGPDSLKQYLAEESMPVCRSTRKELGVPQMDMVPWPTFCIYLKDADVMMLFQRQQWYGLEGNTIRTMDAFDLGTGDIVTLSVGHGHDNMFFETTPGTLAEKKTKYKNAVNQSYSLVKHAESRGVSFSYVEVPPTHFNSPTGLYTGNQDNTCKCVPSSGKPGNNLLNEAANEVFASWGVPVIQIYDVLTDAVDEHIETDCDCSHYDIDAYLLAKSKIEQQTKV